jgi:hypothetical protein
MFSNCNVLFLQWHIARDCLGSLVKLVIHAIKVSILIVGDIFEPVTWHHQRRPFIRAPTCKTAKTRRGWPAEPPPTIKSVQYLCEEGRQKESERERVQERGKNPPVK